MSPTIVIEPGEVAALQDPQFHRREVLGLVDDDVAVGDELGLVEFSGSGPGRCAAPREGPPRGRRRRTRRGRCRRGCRCRRASLSGRGRRRGPSRTRASSISAASALVHSISSSVAERLRYEQFELVVAEEVLAGGAQQRRGAEEVVQQLLARESGPDALQRLFELGGRADQVGQFARRPSTSSMPSRTKRSWYS